MSIRSCLVNQPKNKLILNNEQLFNATDISPITFGTILPSYPRGKSATNSQMNPKSTAENKNSKVRAIKILLDSEASALIVYKDILYERHRILKDKKNVWSTMARTFYTIFVIKIILKLPELNHSATIYEKYHLTKELLNHNLILGKGKLQKLEIIF